MWLIFVLAKVIFNDFVFVTLFCSLLWPFVKVPLSHLPFSFNIFDFVQDNFKQL